MSTDHVVIHDGTVRPFGFECLNCGSTMPLGMPIATSDLVAASEMFVAKHRDCRSRGQDEKAMAVLALPMQENDAEARTIADYLRQLLRGVLTEKEGFNGKRPFGNSGWIGDLEKSLVKHGVVKGSFDPEGEYLDRVDEAAALKTLLDAVDALFDRASRPPAPAGGAS